MTPKLQAAVTRMYLAEAEAAFTLLGPGAPPGFVACIAFLLSEGARRIAGTILYQDEGYSIG